MRSKATRQFWRLFSGLPGNVQQDARRVYILFRSNPAHSGLQFKKLESDEVYSVRVGLGHRALAVMRKGYVLWFWIGNHADYDRLT